MVALQVARILMESAAKFCEDSENKKPLLIVTAGQKSDDHIMKYLDANSGESPNKICKGWRHIHQEFGLSSESEFGLVPLARAVAKRCEGRKIVMLVDEITDLATVNELNDQSVPKSISMVLVVNPVASRYEHSKLNRKYLNPQNSSRLNLLKSDKIFAIQTLNFKILSNAFEKLFLGQKDLFMVQIMILKLIIMENNIEVMFLRYRVRIKFKVGFQQTLSK